MEIIVYSPACLAFAFGIGAYPPDLHMHKSIFIAIQKQLLHKFALKYKQVSCLKLPQLDKQLEWLSGWLQRFSTAQVCQIITGENREADYP